MHDPRQQRVQHLYCTPSTPYSMVSITRLFFTTSTSRNVSVETATQPFHEQTFFAQQESDDPSQPPLVPPRCRAHGSGRDSAGLVHGGEFGIGGSSGSSICQ